jgi:hypothetical protein
VIGPHLAVLQMAMQGLTLLLFYLQLMQVDGRCAVLHCQLSCFTILHARAEKLEMTQPCSSSVGTRCAPTCRWAAKCMVLSENGLFLVLPGLRRRFGGCRCIPCDVTYAPLMQGDGTSKTTALACCGYCKSAWYCSRTCQQQAWAAGHSKACKQLRR